MDLSSAKNKIILSDSKSELVFILFIAPLIGVTYQDYLKAYQNIEVVYGEVMFTSIFLALSLSYFFVRLFLKRFINEMKMLDATVKDNKIDVASHKDSSHSRDNIFTLVGILFFFAFIYFQFILSSIQANSLEPFMIMKFHPLFVTCLIFFCFAMMVLSYRHYYNYYNGRYN